MIVTFDLFSALTDTRAGAARAFAEIAGERGWGLSGGVVYDTWDRHNKALQRDARAPQTFAEVSGVALRAAYADLGLDPEAADADLSRLHSTIEDWPLWPNAEEGVRRVAEFARVGLLSNVDNDLARRTRAAGLLDPALLLTSERLRAFKPDPAIYRAAVAIAAPDSLVHVAASARDVRGALEAGIDVVRWARPGHGVDPDGPPPNVEVTAPREIADAVRSLAGQQG